MQCAEIIVMVDKSLRCTNKAVSGTNKCKGCTARLDARKAGTK